MTGSTTMTNTGTKARTGPARRKGPAAPRFRAAIEAAEAEGVKREAMTLRLTLRDVSELKRDPAVPVDDIHYADGEMRFLGVKVVQGGIVDSALDRGDEG